MQRSLHINLNYHDFSGTAFPNYSRSVYTLNFSLFLKQLNELTFLNNVPLIKILDDIPERLSYSLTFDDGKKSNLYIAEELARREISGTFFIISNRCQSRGYLSKSDILELRKLGMEIGSHSCTHRHLSRLPQEEMMRELQDSKHFLEDIISQPVYCIAYPGGHCGKREFDAALESGYRINRTCIIGINVLPLNKKYVKNINIKSDTPFTDFMKIINLNDYWFLKMKIREQLLALPKLIHSKFYFNYH
jgi:peptidoglycan/xylan/chitin deacetylase (PgdA/CDA1 family)